ncbi:MAG: hypothetical protein AB1644_03965 [Candidatus Zixiibacteriota bacterium]
MGPAENKSRYSGWSGIIILAILLLCLGLRLYKLGADPPIDVSRSNDIYTDTGQYTLFARLYLQTGDFNPLHDFRFVLFLKSSVTALAVVVFKLFGVGIWQSNLVGVIYSWGALTLFGLFVRKVAGNKIAILFLLFAGFDYSLTFYGRAPFLEHAMAFYAFLALVMCSYFRKWPAFALAGLSLGVAIFFGKVMGLVFLAPFAVLIGYRLFHDGVELPRIRLSAPIAFVAGIAAVATFWYFFSYSVMQEQVAGYLEEQTVSLYGAPEALNSFDEFVYKMVTFGIFSQLFPRLPVPAILSAVFLGVIAFQAVQKRSWEKGHTGWNAGHLFVAAMIVAFYGALMIWNYRPLRYQLVMIYAMQAGAASLIARVARPWQPSGADRIPLLFYPICFALGLVPIYQVYGRIREALGEQFYFTDFKYWLALASAVTTGLVAWGIVLYRRRVFVYKRVSAFLAASVLGAVIVGTGIGSYVYWAQRPVYIARDNSRDLAMVVSPEAVVSGPFGPNMTLETNLKSIIHMFGVSKADTALFKKYPITHILVDEPNESRATQDYPEVMKASTHVATYAIGKNKVRLFRVAGATGNYMSDSYPLSLYEQLSQAYREGETLLAEQAGRRYMELYPANMSGCLLIGDQAEEHGQFDVAEQMYKKAIEFSPSSYVLTVKLARFYRDRFIATEKPEYKQEALGLFERALHDAPGAEAVFSGEYERLKVSEAWQLKPDTTL